jgi:hypothetical protein
MNGAELPCGTAIMVQPSDPLYKLRRKREVDTHYGPVCAHENTRTSMANNNADLDDFFESLDDMDDDSGRDNCNSGKDSEILSVRIKSVSAPVKAHTPVEEDEDGDLEGFFQSLS